MLTSKLITVVMASALSVGVSANPDSIDNIPWHDENAQQMNVMKDQALADIMNDNRLAIKQRDEKVVQKIQNRNQQKSLVHAQVLDNDLESRSPQSVFVNALSNYQ